MPHTGGVVPPQSVTRRRGVASATRVLVLVAGAVLLGAVLAAIKGRGEGLGYWVGNLSAPYLLVPFLVGRVVGRLPTAVVAGVAVTWASLAGFYGSADALYGYLSGATAHLYLEWFVAGIGSGAAVGALGHLSTRRAALTYVLPLAFVLEPAAVALVQLTGRFGGFTTDPLEFASWSAEAAAGAVFVGLTATRLRHDRRPRPSR